MKTGSRLEWVSLLSWTELILVNENGETDTVLCDNDQGDLARMTGYTWTRSQNTYISRLWATSKHIVVLHSLAKPNIILRVIYCRIPLIQQMSTGGWKCQT